MIPSFVRILLGIYEQKPYTISRKDRMIQVKSRIRWFSVGKWAYIRDIIPQIRLLHCCMENTSGRFSVGART